MSQSPRPFSPTNEESKLAKLEHLRHLSHLWDKAFVIPGTNFRFGLESIIGLLPVGGDLVGIALSSYVLLQALQFNLPKTLLVRMLFNILLDGVVGSIPFVGDLFDTTWKANTKNVKLLEAHLNAPEINRKEDSRFFAMLFGGVFLLGILLIMLFVIMVRFITSLFFG
ncbi:MAG: DUF4112 domain-containing protein [Scytonematopsis contorta HA4267-MV1]|jgi:Domain of unknown function (DUF4112)|nr:DUF4112 domain-containing protein [Scytonematopsis contorta HA4267-MV1]